MKLSYQLRAQQLGMPWGTAQNRLRRQLMFLLVKKAGEDICFKCGERILAVEELTMEHKVPWLNQSPDLFWDLDNIAFSHAKCNIPHSFPGRVSPRRGPDDTWLCKTCQRYLPVVAFSMHKHKTPRTMCKECRRTQQKLHGHNAI